MRFTRFWFFILFATTSLHMQAEIQRVIAVWNPFLCRETCLPLLNKNLQAMPGVATIQFNGPSGVADIRYHPNAGLNLSAVNTAFRSTGIRLDAIRARVRGKIAHQGSDFYLVSTGDNSRFQLIGPTVFDPARYSIRQNIATHPLPEATQLQLLDAEAKGQTVTVEGPLFEPNRYALILITEQINISR